MYFSSPPLRTHARTHARVRHSPFLGPEQTGVRPADCADVETVALDVSLGVPNASTEFDTHTKKRKGSERKKEKRLKDC